MSMRRVYREIAKKHGVSVEEVKRDIQAAINSAYVKPNSLAKKVIYRGNEPTPEELIAHLMRMIKTETQ